MKKFLLKIVLFLGFFAVVAIASDLWISKTLAKAGSYAMGDAKIWNDILKGQINDDLLIYGSSRAWKHFDPEFIESETGMTSYNFGVDGLAFDIQYLRHELYLKYHKPPKAIIYSVDINTLSISEGLYNDEQFLPFFYSDPLFNSYIKKYVNFSFTDFNLPLIRYSGREKALKYFMKEIIRRPEKNKRTKGFDASIRTWNTDFKKASKSKKRYERPIDINVLKRFDEFLIEAKSMDIAVVLMYAPEHFLGQNLIVNRKEIITIFDSLAKKNKIPFYNYSKDTMNNNKNYFYNSLHLNAKGVEEFNKLYRKDLKNFVNGIDEK